MRAFLALASLLSILGTGHSAAARGLEIAITVDDLPVHGPLPPGETRLKAAQQMISALRAPKVPPVYGFANGTHLDADPQAESVLTAWRTAGYPLASHSFSHLNLNQVSSAEYLEDIVKNEPLLKRLSRSSDWRWFRYPFLAEGDDSAKRAEVRQFLGARGYRIAGVTMSYWDYEWNDAYARCRTEGDAASLDRLERAYLAAVQDGIDYWRRLAWSVYGRDIPYVLLTHISPSTRACSPASSRSTSSRGSASSRCSGPRAIPPIAEISSLRFRRCRASSAAPPNVASRYTGRIRPPCLPASAAEGDLKGDCLAAP